MKDTFTIACFTEKIWVEKQFLSLLEKITAERRPIILNLPTSSRQKFKGGGQWEQRGLMRPFTLRSSKLNDATAMLVALEIHILTSTKMKKSLS